MSPYYEDEFVTLYHDDVRSVVGDLPSFGLLLADPPYGIGFAAQPTTGQRKRGMQARKWDDRPVDAALLVSLIALCEKAVVWGGNYYALPPARCVLSWYKPDSPPSMGSVEYAWTNLDQNSRQISHSISATNPERVGHPNQKPLRVMAWTINQVGPVNGAALVPFAGSGTELVALKNQNIPATGVEREEEYCEMIATRLSQSVFDFGESA